MPRNSSKRTLSETQNDHSHCTHQSPTVTHVLGCVSTKPLKWFSLVKVPYSALTGVTNATQLIETYIIRNPKWQKYPLHSPKPYCDARIRMCIDQTPETILSGKGTLVPWNYPPLQPGRPKPLVTKIEANVIFSKYHFLCIHLHMNTNPTIRIKRGFHKDNFTEYTA